MELRESEHGEGGRGGGGVGLVARSCTCRGGFGAPPNLTPTPVDRPTLEFPAVPQVELHDLRERGEHSNVTWDERVCRWWEVQTHGHHTGAQLR